VATSLQKRRAARIARHGLARKVRRTPRKDAVRPAYLQAKPAEDELARAAAAEQPTQTRNKHGAATDQASMAPPADAVEIDAELEQQITAQQGLGAALPDTLRQEMQAELGADLAGVRIHDDEQADRLATRLQAHAFTVGQDIFFAAGQYAPETNEGRRLLAHELTHVVQGQSADLPGPARQVQRDWWGDLGGRVNDWLAGDPCLSAFHESERWARNGPYPAAPQSIIGAGGRGGFDAQYQPDPIDGDGQLAITQGVAVEFKDTFIESGGTITPHPDLPADPTATAKAAGIDAIADPALRTATLAQYQWAPAEHAPWIARLEPLIEDSWGHQHDFFLNVPRWDWLGASVDVDLDVGERAQAATDHMYLENYKMPSGEYMGDVGANHEVDRGADDDPRDQRMTLSSTNLEANPYDILKVSVLFANNADILDGDAQSRLDRFMQRFRSADAHAAHQEIRVDLVGHASAVGDEVYNLGLSRRRVAAVTAYLRSKGFPNVDSRIHPDPRGEREADTGNPDNPGDRRVDILVDGGERQIAALHEWGHAFGLMDEYPGGSRNVGDDAGHHDLAAAMTLPDGSHLPGATIERTGGIMASGNDIRPRYYATFHHALQTVTAKSPWSLGLHKPKWEVGMECGEPSPPGDWNLPDNPDGNRQA